MLQVTLDGRRNQIFLTLSTAAEFRDNLNLFSEYYSQLGEYCKYLIIHCLVISQTSSFSLRECAIYILIENFNFTGPPNPDHVPEDGKLKSEVIIKDNRRYYLDLKENTRGRFLRVRIIISVA